MYRLCQRVKYWPTTHFLKCGQARVQPSACLNLNLRVRGKGGRALLARMGEKRNGEFRGHVTVGRGTGSIRAQGSAVDGLERFAAVALRCGPENFTG